MKIGIERMLSLILATLYVATPTYGTTTLFTLTLEAEENLVSAGAKVKVDITVRNSSNRAMDISYGLSELDYNA